MVRLWCQCLKGYIYTFMSHSCKYCNAVFTRATSVSKHQSTAKYCLAIQEKEEPKQYYCSNCDMGFSRRDTLARHQKNCKRSALPTRERLGENKQLKDQIEDLKQIITQLVERPTNNNNNNINNVVMNIAPITDEEIANHLEHLTLAFIQKGAKGYADFANNYPFKDRLVCTDKARKKLRYKDGDGEVVDDNGGHKLTQRFFQAIAPRNEEIINAEYRVLQQQVQHIADTGTGGTSNLTELLTKASHLQEILVQCQQAALGEENEFTREFVHHLSKML